MLYFKDIVKCVLRNAFGTVARKWLYKEPETYH
jgi:hypothetical protein